MQPAAILDGVLITFVEDVALYDCLHNHNWTTMEQKMPC